MQALIRAFADDPGVRLAAVLVALDIVLGILAALKASTFRIGWLSDFLRADILYKLLPYFGVWAAVRLGGDVELRGIGVIEETINAALIAALGGSILNSLRDLNVPVVKDAPDAIAGPAEPPPIP